MENEDEFFARWLKQRENLGAAGGSKRDLLAASDAMGRTGQSALSGGIMRKATVSKRKDATQAELDKLNADMEKAGRLKNYKIEDKTVRKAADVSIISAHTIEALVRFLNISEDDTEFELSKKLNESMVSGGLNKGRDGSTAARNTSLVDLANATIAEAPEEDDDRDDDLGRDDDDAPATQN